MNEWIYTSDSTNIEQRFLEMWRDDQNKLYALATQTAGSLIWQEPNAMSASTCAHKLQMWTDTTAMCTVCGDQFECEKL